MKRFYRFLLLPLLFVLVACGGTSAKDTFISRLESNQSAKQSAYEMTFALEEMDTGESGINPLAGFIGQELTVYISQDQDKNLVGFTADLSALSPDLSAVEMIYADDKAYISAAPMLAMSGQPLADYQGKYLDLEAASGQTLPALSNFTPADYQNVELYQKLDAKNFSQKGDDVTVTMSLAELLALTKDTLAKTDEKAAQAYADQSDQIAQQFSPESKVELTLDKQGDGKARVNLLPAGDGQGSLTLSMAFKKATYKAPNLPAQSDILSQDQLNQLMTANLPQDLQMSDEDFQAFYTSLETSVSNYTKEDFQAMIEALKPSLTEEQVKKLESLLPKTKAN